MDLEVTGTFFGTGMKKVNGLHWIGVRKNASSKDVTFFDHWGTVPKEISELPKGIQVRVFYEEEKVMSKEGNPYTNLRFKRLELVRNNEEAMENEKREKIKELKGEIDEFNKLPQKEKENVVESLFDVLEKKGKPFPVGGIGGTNEALPADGKEGRYRKYQADLLKECYEDAKAVVGDVGAKDVAVAFFEKRCTPLNLYI